MAESNVTRTTDGKRRGRNGRNRRHQGFGGNSSRNNENEGFISGDNPQRKNRRNGPNYGRGGGFDALNRVNSRRDEHGSKFKMNMIRNPKEYEHLLYPAANRRDHGGIKFEGQVAECDICCCESDVFAVGSCLHPICIECGIRLRVLCKNETCPKCRTVIDTLYLVPFPGDWNAYELPVQCVEHEGAEIHKIKLMNDYVARCYDSYLIHQCLICEKKGERRVFKIFAELNQHMYMVHRLEFCDICVENLNLFTRERKVYSHLDLQKHIEHGDSDDKSHRGHPQCLFCAKRFLDEEFRYKHLRKEHFFCQICDADGGSNYFFSEHGDLLNHYKGNHIICEEGECLQLGIVFRTDNELKLHKSRDHAAGPQVLNLDFHFRDRDTAGPSHTGRATPRPPLRSKLPSQRNLPRISLIPPACETRPSDTSDVTIVPSAQSESASVSLRYRGTQFKLQGSDFPPLNTTSRNNPCSEVPAEAIQFPKAVTANKIKNASNQAEVNAAASDSWLIDDDEQFPPHRPHPSTLISQDTRSKQTGKIHKEQVKERGKGGLQSSRMPKVESSSRTSTTELSWSNVIKKSQPLSNAPAALMQNEMPDLPTSGAVQFRNSLPPGSVWAKKNPLAKQANTSRKKKQLPVTWPEESVQENWEDLDDSVSAECTTKATLKDVITIKDPPGRKKGIKTNINKEQIYSSRKRSDHLLADREKDALKTTAGDEFVDPIPSLPCQTQSEIEDTSSTTKSSFGLLKLLSSAFSSVLGSTTKDDENQLLETVPSESVIKVPASHAAFSDRNKESAEKTLDEELLLGLGSPPGLSPIGLAPPPGFGPPPGFENLAGHTEDSVTEVSDMPKVTNSGINFKSVPKPFGKKK